MQEVQEDRQRQCRRHITAICEECGRDEPGTRPLNILIVGKQGCGKSSFIDSVAAALSEDRWVEHAIVGSREHARQVTNFIVQYKKCCNPLLPHYGRIQLPTLIDVPGLLDTEANEQMQKFLRLLMYGHIRNQEFAHTVYQDCQMDWDDLLVRYSRAYDDMKVDRVIFVASAVDDNLPHRLMDCVMNAARPPQGFRRQIPVFGVMTKMDRVNDENRTQFEATKRELKSALGLHEGRILCCSNYCDDTDPDKVRQDRLIPHLDLPILRFFREVCDRRLLTINQDDVIRASFDRHLQALLQRYRLDPVSAVGYLAGALSVCVVFYLLYYALFAPDPCDTVKSYQAPYYDLCVATLHDRLHIAAGLALAAFFALFSCLLLRGPF